MTRSTAFLPRFIALAALAGGALAGCKAFNLDPQTDLAESANAAARGYPRLADVPPEPADIACVRAAMNQSMQVVEPEPNVFEGTEDAGVLGQLGLNSVYANPVYQVQVATVPDARRTSVASLLGGVARDVMGDGGDEEAPGPALTLLDCPPGPLIEAERLGAERRRLEAIAAEIRAGRQTAPEPVTLPDDLPPLTPGTQR